MLLTSKPSNDPAITTKHQSLAKYLRLFMPSGKRLSTLALLAAIMASPLYAQAALPAAIQAALGRADLTAADISIVITPVGDKNASRLPAPIQIVNSSEITNSDKHSDDHINKQNTPVYQSPLLTIEKQTIQKHEQQLHAYTDDPYTYQSLKNTPSILPDDTSTSANNGSSNEGSDVAINAAPTNATPTKNTSIKISFSPLINHQADIPRTPASTMKLVPSFIALDTLGADFVWHTRVYHSGIIIGDRLYGDLIIQGSGDPKMTHERLQQLLYRVQAAGIRHIDGNIIIDSAVFDHVSKDPAAFDNAPLRPYNASPDGFLVNFSTIGIKSYPLDNGQASLDYTPKLADYQLPTTISTRTASCGQARYSLAPQWQPNQLTLNNNLPDSCGEHVFYVAYPDAKNFAARVIAAKWQALGNTLSGKVISQETPYRATKNSKSTQGLAALSMSPLPLVSYPSLTLTQQIYDINHFSNNVMTEQVVLSIGAYNQSAMVNSTTKASSVEAVDNKTMSKQTSSLYQFGKPAATDYPAALQTINQWWESHLNTPPPYLTNGSGLCRDCTITAANLSELLTYAYSHPSFDAYVNSLGVAGVSGTIAAHGERLPESDAIGRAWIKTGTLNNVTSMAGYVKGLSGQDYVVVGLINTEQALNATTARPVLDVVLDWTAQQ
ncbi:D-alanyl-D-alanine carboxypeptidase/D-alanyl-D-alanine-endopeptidase [Psychrobacter sp. Sarcosine-3u-12]|uniref:D-alanyl-D-alanine carboxypeptidase/D-alanyl-D-alanine-endopeptidase n=1 Tax=Psychrobacter sp. Sarcosine-3u-12 TaxID=2058325 RepID=UPI000C31F544|nr:D-alanyl-D-alanine carboxypeptidase [Psychrobacter sp. Sarcosine-3u-12]PKG36447.1 D-alanyl-D-alanine carboxypeptidase [Psychrobacter sp. Sarcosine-3u-12]